MEESLKYFVPEISDIRIGYECEYRLSGKDWLKLKIEKSDALFINSFINDLENGNLRTPYLTKEQLGAEGWNHFDTVNNQFKKGDYNLIYKFGSRNLQIADTNSSYGYQIKFDGECKDINTFRFLVKLLNI